jgi:hypothetical protein
MGSTFLIAHFMLLLSAAPPATRHASVSARAPAKPLSVNKVPHYHCIQVKNPIVQRLAHTRTNSLAAPAEAKRDESIFGQMVPFDQANHYRKGLDSPV